MADINLCVCGNAHWSDKPCPSCLRSARPESSAAVRDDGWYWVRKKGWCDEYGEWVPALWQTEYRSWRSAMFSGIPDSEMMVGDKMVPPNAL